MVETSTIRIKLNDILKMMAYHGGQENEWYYFREN
jgi:hypothetical protein